MSLYIQVPVSSISLDREGKKISTAGKACARHPGSTTIFSSSLLSNVKYFSSSISADIIKRQQFFLLLPYSHWRTGHEDFFFNEDVVLPFSPLALFFSATIQLLLFFNT